MKIEDLAIIGGGPAGVVAAIYAFRAKVTPVIFDDFPIGGKLKDTLLIENFPGVCRASGPELQEKFQKQVKYHNIEHVPARVVELDYDKKQKFFSILTDEKNQKKRYFRFVVIGTGTREKKLPLPRAKELEGRGVSYCSTCDGAFFSDLKIAVVGGGNSALEESLALSLIASEVLIINMAESLTAQATLVDRIQKKKNIKILNNHVVSKLFGEKVLEGIEVSDLINKKTKKIDISGMFVYIGTIPNSELLNPDWKLTNKDGFIVTNEQFETRIPNLFAVGDIADRNFQQYTIAMGSATIATLKIVRRFAKIDEGDS